MGPTAKLWIVAAGFGLVAALGFYCLPEIAGVFYEAYHATGIEPFYLAYGGFKFMAGYIQAMPAPGVIAAVLGVLVMLAAALPSWLTLRWVGSQPRQGAK